MKPGLSQRTHSSPLAKPSLPLLQGRLVGNAATVDGVDGMQEFVQQDEAHVFRM